MTHFIPVIRSTIQYIQQYADIRKGFIMYRKVFTVDLKHSTVNLVKG